MLAVVTIAGQQFKVQEGQEIFVHNLNANEGDELSFDEILLVSSENNTTLGTPHIKGAQIGATVLNQAKGDKVVVFKKKRRKGYKLKRGHRQQFTKIKINSISL